MRTNDSYVMSTTTSCGPDALSFVLAKQFPAQDPGYAAIINLWEWPNTQDWRDNARDFIGAHFRVLDLLRIPHRLVSITELVSGDIKPPAQCVVALLHDYPHRVARSKGDPYFFQHWVVIENIDVDKGLAFFHDGRGSVVKYPIADLIYWLTAGAPNCLYIVGSGTIGCRWPERFWDYFASKVIAAYTWIMGK